jgi:photosystem II stability/assembly factor-like uncharacterized protein
MTELLVGTKKGLFVLAGEDSFEVTTRQFAGEPVEYAMRDRHSGRYFAAMISPFYGPKLLYTDDPAGTDWEQAKGLTLPEGSDQTLERIWTLVADDDGTLYLGGDPGVLFTSRDSGTSWELNRALWEHPTRPEWQPGGGGLCLHSIVPTPGEPGRLACGISAVGIWLTDDGGETWRHGNQGIKPRYLPDDAPQDTIALCIHNVKRAPKRPERLFMQFHGGVYRSDDGAESWTYIGDGLPSDFGFPLVVDPADPDSAFVIPLRADMDRVTPEGHVRVYETRDAGESWTPRGDGLPAEHAYLTVLRQAFDSTGGADALELYFGATSGDVFGSADAGASWSAAATRLPPVYSVRVA